MRRVAQYQRLPWLCDPPNYTSERCTQAKRPPSKRAASL